MAARRKSGSKRKRVGRRVSPIETLKRILLIQEMLAAGGNEAQAVAWAMTKTPPVKDGDAVVIEGKEWTVTEQTARAYVSRAYQTWMAEGAEDVEKARLARQATAQLVLRRAIARGTVQGDELALKANHQLAQLQGAYTAERGLPLPEGPSMDLDEAVKEIDHAHATLALMRRRGLVGAGAVIDAAAVEAEPELEDDDEDDELEPDEGDEDAAPRVAAAN